MEAGVRKIIHMDMDAFYASVEQRDHPEYRGKPLIVGGSPHARGVVATCSYEARRFGVHSAMPSQTALRLCPDAIFVRPRMEVYRAVSQEIMAIFRAHTDLVEPLSLDEAYLDVTAIGAESATAVAREIKRTIRSRTALTVSAGVSYNKFIAKIASDYRKPDGLTVIVPSQAQAFLDAVPVGKFFGVGKVTEARFAALGVQTGAELRALSREALCVVFADRGHQFYDLARGIDQRPVQPHRVRQSIGVESTLQVDIEDQTEMVRVLSGLAESLASTLSQRAARGRVVVLKVKYHNFAQITRRTTTTAPVQSPEEILLYAKALLTHVPLQDKVRLLGIAVHGLVFGAPQWEQLTLF